MFFLLLLVRLLHRKVRSTAGTLLALIVRPRHDRWGTRSVHRTGPDRLGNHGLVPHPGENMKSLTTIVIGFALAALLAPQAFQHRVASA